MSISKRFFVQRNNIKFINLHVKLFFYQKEEKKVFDRETSV